MDIICANPIYGFVRFAVMRIKKNISGRCIELQRRCYIKVTLRQKLLYLIEKYYIGEYRTENYTSYLVKLYHMENDGTLTDEEREILDSLIECAVWFSPYERDYQDDIGKVVYIRDDIIRSKNEEAYNDLLKLYQVTSLERIYAEWEIRGAFCYKLKS